MRADPSLFRAVMENRAENCGLDIDIQFEDTGCRIKLMKKQF